MGLTISAAGLEGCRPGCGRAGWAGAGRSARAGLAARLGSVQNARAGLAAWLGRLRPGWLGWSRTICAGGPGGGTALAVLLQNGVFSIHYTKNIHRPRLLTPFLFVSTKNFVANSAFFSELHQFHPCGSARRRFFVTFRRKRGLLQQNTRMAACLTYEKTGPY